MNQWKKLLVDSGLILIGIGLSTWFVSTDGNGQNPLPVAASLFFVALIAGLVSFVIARFIQDILISILVSVFTTDFMFVLYFVCRFNSSPQPPPHGNEELILGPIIFVVATAPTILFAAIGFGRFASRFYQKRVRSDDQAGSPSTIS